jgi:Family of unknown function (DUF6152)
MKSKPAAFFVGLGLLLAPTAMLAHHALQAQFDTKQTITLTGAVTRMDWSNPHVRLYIQVKDEKNTATWELYMGSPNLQMMKGLKIDTYRRGDHVKVDAYPARDGSNIGYATKVTAVSAGRFDR